MGLHSRRTVQVRVRAVSSIIYKLHPNPQPPPPDTVGIGLLARFVIGHRPAYCGSAEVIKPSTRAYLQQCQNIYSTCGSYTAPVNSSLNASSPNASSPPCHPPAFRRRTLENPIRSPTSHHHSLPRSGMGHLLSSRP